MADNESLYRGPFNERDANIAVGVILDGIALYALFRDSGLASNILGATALVAGSALIGNALPQPKPQPNISRGRHNVLEV